MVHGGFDDLPYFVHVNIKIQYSFDTYYVWAACGKRRFEIGIFWWQIRGNGDLTAITLAGEYSLGYKVPGETLGLLLCIY